jgi:hypothetical protein
MIAVLLRFRNNSKPSGHHDRFLATNRGMGANNSAGLKECSGRKYILPLQDDWECHGPRHYVKDSLLLVTLTIFHGAISLVVA